MSVDDADLIARLGAENLQLRQILDDERRHVAVLRETVRQLRDELAGLRAGQAGSKPRTSRSKRGGPRAIPGQ
jgi:hypothetical protein